MKFLLSFLLITVLSGIVSYFTSIWWLFIVVSVIVGTAMKMDALTSFFCGFLSIAILWGVYAGWIDASNGGILTNRLIETFNVSNSYYLIFGSASIGGIMGGLGTMTGSLGQSLVSSPKSNLYGKQKRRRMKRR